MTIKYLDSKRISLDTSATFTGDYSTQTGWTQVGSTISITGGYAYANNSGSALGAYIHTPLGSTLSDTKWIAEFEYYNVGAVNLFPFILASGTSTVWNSTQDMIGVGEENPNMLKIIYKDGSGSVQQSPSTGFSSTMSTGTTYYCTVIRDGSSLSLKLYTDSARTVQFGSDATLTISGTVSGLTTLHHSGRDDGGATSGYYFKVKGTKIYDGVTSTPAKPTNVQDNSILVEKDTGKRYWFTAQTGDTPTFEDDYDYATQTLADSAWVPTDTAKIRVNVTNDNLAYTAVNDGSNDLVTHDLGASVSETKWVLRWKQTITTLTDGGTNQSRFVIGLGDTITGAATNQDFIGAFIGWFNTSAHKHYYTNWANGGRGDTANSSEISLVPATGTKYYELIRTSASTFEFSISSTSAYTKDVLSTVSRTGVTATGLRYIKMFNREGGSGGAQIIGTVDDLYFYNDITSVTSVTPATWTKDRQVTSGSALCSGGKSTDGGSPTTNTQASSDGVWANITSISTARQMAHGIGNANNFTIAGGYNGVNNSQTWNGNSWATEIAINTQRRDTTAIAGSYDDCVVACGRNTAGTLLNTASKFDGTTWSATSSNANTAREHPAGSGQADSMLVAGGYDASGTSDKVDSYDGTTFTNGTVLPNAVYGSNMAASANDSAHITGGYSGGGSTPYSGTYDGSSWTATTQYPVSTAHYFGGGGGDRDEHLVMGGYNANVSPLAYYDTTYLWNGTSWVAKNDLMEDKAQGAGDCTAR
mgnify:CR=1 FL=1